MIRGPRGGGFPTPRAYAVRLDSGKHDGEYLRVQNAEMCHFRPEHPIADAAGA